MLGQRFAFEQKRLRGVLRDLFILMGWASASGSSSRKTGIIEARDLSG